MCLYIHDIIYIYIENFKTYRNVIDYLIVSLKPERIELMKKGYLNMLINKFRLIVFYALTIPIHVCTIQIYLANTNLLCSLCFKSLGGFSSLLSRPSPFSSSPPFRNVPTTVNSIQDFLPTLTPGVVNVFLVLVS